MKSIEEILDRAKWFYVSQRAYKTFHILIVENVEDDWTFYYLDKHAESEEQIADITGMLAGLDIFMDVPAKKKIETPLKQQFNRKDVPDEYTRIRKFDVFRTLEKQLSKRNDVDRNISGCIAIREVHGNFGAMVHEFLKIIK